MMYGGRFLGGGGCGLFGFHSGFGFFGMLINIGFLILVGVLIYYFVKKQGAKTSNQNALEILKMKYVQGEITEEEYLKRKQVLSDK